MQQQQNGCNNKIARAIQLGWTFDNAKLYLDTRPPPPLTPRVCPATKFAQKASSRALSSSKISWSWLVAKAEIILMGHLSPGGRFGNGKQPREKQKRVGNYEARTGDDSR